MCHGAMMPWSNTWWLIPLGQKHPVVVGFLYGSSIQLNLGLQGCKAFTNWNDENEPPSTWVNYHNSLT